MIGSKTGKLAVACAAIGSLVLAGCSTKSVDEEISSDGVRTGGGISGKTINLGVVADLTGPFSVLSADHTRGVRLYWDAKNADGGVCSTYKVKLVVKDHGYNVQQAVLVFKEINADVLAYQDFVGGSQTAAILPDAEADSRLVLPSSATRQLMDSPVVLIPAADFTTDMESVIDRLVDDGLVSKGDDVANIWVEGDYGAESNEGAKKGASEHDLSLHSYQVKPTDTDLSAAVSNALNRGAKAILASTTPGQTASIAAALQASKAETPIGGAYPTFASSLLKTPAAGYLKEHYTATSYLTTFDTPAGSDLYERLTKAYPKEDITLQASAGYVAAALMDEVLEAACAAGDLTPEGVVAQRKSIDSFDAGGLATLMDYSKPGQSPTDTSWFVRADPSVGGGLRLAK